jgi:hypothetical protein
MTVFWDVATCSLVKFADVSEVLPASIIALMITLVMEAASTFETLKTLYQTTRHNFPEDSRLHIRCRENLKSHHIKPVLLLNFEVGHLKCWKVFSVWNSCSENMVK